MTAWRISAWTHPGDPGGFALREHSIPAVGFSGNDPDEPRGRCTITVPETYDWRTLINVQNPTDPADTSLIRLYRVGQDNTTEPDVEYKLERFKKRITDDGQAVVDLFGIDWRLDGLDNAIVRPWDWTPGATLTRQSDWSYGGSDQANLLNNLDFTTSGVGEKQQYHVHGSAGTYAITVPSFGTTVGIAPYEAGGRASDVKAALEGIAGINEVATSGKGHTQYDPMVIEFKDPLQNIGQITIDETLLTNSGCAHPPCHSARISTIQNGEFDAEPWTTNQRARDGAIVPSFHGGSTLSVVADPVLGDPDKAMLVTPTRGNGGVQQAVEEGEPGFRANATVDLYSASTTDEFTLAIFDVADNRIATSGPVTLAAANTWETFALDFQLPDNLAGGIIVWRISVASSDGDSVPSPFHMRAPGLFYGLSAAAIGVIAGDLLDDANTDHSPSRVALPYVTQGAFTDTLDSSGAGWPRDEHLIIRRGQKYGSHIFGSQFADLGYEYDLRPGAGAGAGETEPDTANWYLELWDEGNRGTTLTGLAFHVGFGVAGGLVAGRVPKATTILAEGKDGILAEATDSAQEGQTGVREDYVGDPDIIDIVTLQAKANFLLNDDLTNRIAFTVELDDNGPTPYADFDIGDTAPFSYFGTTDAHNRRISDIALRAEARAGELQWSASITASKLLTGAGARNEALYRLLTAFGRFPQKLPKPASLESGEVGGQPSVVVAAADASSLSKAKADLWCDGINDEDVILDAIDLLTAVTGGGGGGLVILTEGNFSVDVNDVITVGSNQNVTITGLGQQATQVTTSDTTGAIFTLNILCTIENMSIIGTGFSGPTAVTGVSASTNNITVNNVYFANLGVGVDITGDHWQVTRCYEGGSVNRIIQGNNGKGNALITGNVFPQSGGLDMGQMQDWSITGNIIGGAILFEENGSPTGEGINITGNYFFAADAYNNAIIEGTSVGASDPSRITITGNQLDSSGDYLIWIEDAVDLTISGNVLSVGWGHVRLINCTGATVTGNHSIGARDDTDAAFYFSGCAELTIEANTIRNADGHGIRLSGTSDSLIEGNHIIRPGRATDDTYDAIILDGDSNRNDIWANKGIGDSGAIQPRWFINVAAATVDDTTYYGNRSGPSADYGRNAAATTTPYNDAGTGTLDTLPAAASPQGANFL